MKTLIISPIHNEKANLRTLIPQIFDTLPQTDLLLIDDHSTDGSRDILKDFQKTNSQIHLIERPKKLGLGSAYIVGFQWGLKRKYDYFFEMDGDGSHHPKYLPLLLNAAKKYDIVLGSRYVPHGNIEDWSFYRRSLSRLANQYAKKILGLPYSDLTGGFKCFRASVLKTIDLSQIKSDGYCFQVELTYLVHQKGFRIKEIPIVFTQRTHGKSKISKRIVWEALIRIPLLRMFSTPC